MKYLTPALAALAVLVAVVRTTGFDSTTALFTDSGTSSSSTVSAGQLAAPTVTATAASGGVNPISVTWTNPNSLSGANASFVVERATGACTAPGAFAALSGSPFPITTLGTMDSPAASGTYCYRVQTKYFLWTSAFGSDDATVTVGPPPITGLKFDSEPASVAGSCAASRFIETGSVSGAVVIDNGTSVTWIGKAGDLLTSLPSGNYSLRLVRTANVSAQTSAAAFSVQIGVCTDTTYTSKGTTTGLGFSGGAETVDVTVNVGSSTTLNASTLIAVRISNTQPGNSKNNTIRLATDGSSTLTAPSSMNP